MKLTKTVVYEKDVYEIKGFLTEEEMKLLSDFIQSSTEKDWANTIEDDLTGNTNDGWNERLLYLKGMQFDFSLLSDRLKNFFLNADHINSFSNIQRYRPNENMPVHIDNHWDKNVKFGIVIYINDNYVDGEIYYPELSLEIKPQAGSLIIHPAGQPHGVKQVGGFQNRYILSAFVHGKDAVLNREVLNDLQ
jgi:hypothetical protein